MTPRRPNDDPDDELLSAYVDGELTDDERARVEQRLRLDPHAARLVDELRRLSSTLRALPRESLGYDLRPSVYGAAAERRAGGLPRRRDGDDPPIAERGFKRGFAWATIAIAATLLLALFAEQPPRDERQLAEVEPPPREQREQRQEKGRALGEIRAPSAAAPKEPAAAVAGADNGLRQPSSQNDAPAAPLVASTEDWLNRNESPEPAQPGVAPTALPDQPELAEALGAEIERLGELGASPPAVTYVELVARSPAALARFEQLLADQGMTVEPLDRAKASPTPAPDQALTRGIRQPAQAADRAPAVPATAAGGESPPRDDARPEGLTEAPVVLVEASADEIGALLDALEADAETFVTVRVHGDSREIPPDAFASSRSEGAVAEPPLTASVDGDAVELKSTRYSFPEQRRRLLRARRSAATNLADGARPGGYGGAAPATTNDATTFDAGVAAEPPAAAVLFYFRQSPERRSEGIPAK